MEAMALIEIVDLPIKHAGFPVRYVNVYQKVSVSLLRSILKNPPMSLGRSWKPQATSPLRRAAFPDEDPCMDEGGAPVR